MKLEVNISKKYFFIILGVLLLLIGVLLVNAYGTNDPPVFGHSVEELDGFPNCASGRYLRHNNGVWSCHLDQTGGGVLQQTTSSRTGTTGTVVSDPCPSGYIRSGCSGGNVGANENYRIGPSGSNRCEITGVVGHQKNIVVHCVRLS